MTKAINEDKYFFVKNPVRIIYRNGSAPSNIELNQVSSTLRQRRPDSTSTGRKGSVYVTPTAWSHSGTVLRAPVVSGQIGPWGINTYYYAFDYCNCIPNVAVSPPPRPSLFTTEMDKLVAACNTQCLLNLKDQKVNLGVALAEAKEAAELVGNAARRIGNLFNAAYNRRPKEWLKGVKNAGKNWKKVPGYYLEHVYGVVPILSDIDGVCQQLAETNNRGNTPRITAYGVRKDSEDYNRSLSSGMQQFGEHRGVGTLERIARVGVTASVPNWVMQDYSSLGVTNPFSVAWERVGYSHVVDWILPIGNWINTWDVSNYLTFESGFTSRFIRASGVITSVTPPKAEPAVLRTDLPGRFRLWEFERIPMVRFPSASFPSLRNPLSLDHMAQGLAMLSQVIQGHKRLASRGPG